MLKYNVKKPGGSDSTGSDTTTTIVTAGNIFVTNITSGGLVSNKLYLSNTVPANYIITEATSDNPTVTIHFIAEPLNTQSPTVQVDSTTCTNLQQYTDDRRLFYGSVTVTVNSSRTIQLESSTGKTTSVIINRALQPPLISDIRFIGGYPSGQTETKQNDTIQVRVTFSNTTTEPALIEVQASGIAQAKTVTPSTTEFNQSSGVYTSTFTISTRFIGNTAQLLPVTIRARNSFGTYCDQVTSTAFGNTETIQTMKGCDLAPTVTIGTVTYPAGQSALKDSENATVNNTVSNYTSVVYSSPNGELSVNSSGTYQASKQVTRIAGTYNISTNNLRIVATRAANGTTTTANGLVNIAHTSHTVSITEQFARLRSSPTGQGTTITITANQRLYEAPTLNVPYGTQSGSWSTANNITQTRSLIINDTDSKGNQNYSGLNSKNMAGRIVNSITGDGTYIIGGFVTRRITFPAFNRLQPIGTSVVNTASLQAVDVGGYTFSYQNSKDNNVLTYTITDSAGNLNPTGNYVYICDDNQVNQNSTGTAQFDIQEVV